MRFIIPILLLSVYSCTAPVQLYETKTTSPMREERGTYIFENDTVKIIYSFWADRGTLSYSVFNKLDVPLYIDWKKSSYVKNADKLDYWKDISTTRGSSKSSAAIIYGTAYGGSYNTSTTVKPEQIVFIAPKSTIAKDQFILYPIKTKFTGLEAFNEMQQPNNPKRTIQVKYTDFTMQTSPLIFRNFLTISTSDKFDKEAYIDNGFYVSRISEIDKSNFWEKKDRYTATSYFQKASNFYVDLKQ